MNQYSIFACRGFITICLILCNCAKSLGADSENAVLVEAQHVAAVKYTNFKYGSDFALHQVNCVQFIGSVLESWIGRDLTKPEQDAVYIGGPFDDINKSVANGDERTKGVVYAITKVMKIGNEIQIKDARPGDIIQYWIKRKNGAWMGHSAIISEVWNDSNHQIRAALYGAHESTDGISFTKFSDGNGLWLNGPDRKVYIARLTCVKSK